MSQLEKEYLAVKAKYERELRIPDLSAFPADTLLRYRGSHVPWRYAAWSAQRIWWCTHYLRSGLSDSGLRTELLGINDLRLEKLVPLHTGDDSPMTWVNVLAPHREAEPAAAPTFVANPTAKALYVTYGDKTWRFDWEQQTWISG